MKTNREWLAAKGIKIDKLEQEKPLLVHNILKAMDDFADQYHEWKKANGSKSETFNDVVICRCYDSKSRSRQSTGEVCEGCEYL